jgi:hypothetical protein
MDAARGRGGARRQLPNCSTLRQVAKIQQSLDVVQRVTEDGDLTPAETMVRVGRSTSSALLAVS